MSKEENNLSNTQKIEETVLQSPAIQPLQNEDNNEKVEPVPIIESQNAKKTEEDIKPLPILKEHVSDSSIIGATSMLTNICLGTTIFTFAVRAKSFGLFWMLFFCFLVAIINYWSIMRCVYASSRCTLDDYSEITEKFLGKRSRFILNIILIVYSYASLMCFIALIFPLFGRFVQSGFYRNDYRDYDHFFD